MSVRIVQLGSPRAPDEGLRIGTVRRPPRGVPRTAYASRDWYDVWFPALAPSVETLRLWKDASAATDWKTFENRYRAEMSARDKFQAIELLARLSHHTNFSVGCYCAIESQCHRSLLRMLLQEHGARLVSNGPA